MSLKTHAEREMKLAGLYNSDSDYGAMIPEAVMALVKAHSEQGHSGGSHWMTLEIFNKVINFKALTPVSNDPEEWIDRGEGMFQSIRQSDLFSHDGLKTCYCVDDKKRGSTPLLSKEELSKKES